MYKLCLLALHFRNFRLFHHDVSTYLITDYIKVKNKLGSAQVPKFGRLLVKIDSSSSIP